jgi:hypothetical protein
MRTKTCPRCGVTKNLTTANFYLRSKKKGHRYCGWCKRCERVMSLRRYHKNKQERLDKRLLKIHGVSRTDFDAMIAKCNNTCAICHRAFSGQAGIRPCIDHNHVTGAQRGLICASCNIGLGCFYENQNSLIRAAGYLNNHS